MSNNSKIEWTGATWNCVAGCSLVSPGCTNCYAMKMAGRLEAMGQSKYVGLTHKVNGRRVWTGKINLVDSALAIPLTTRKPTTWFVNSMSDLFHEDVPFEFVDKVFAVMALTPRHTFQILTKRPERMAEYLNAERRLVSCVGGLDLRRSVTTRAMIQNVVDDAETWDNSPIDVEASAPFVQWPLPNVWLGTSIEDRKRLDDRAMTLAKCPSDVPFWSVEPLLEDLGNIRGYLEQGVQWVIVGAESGHGARRCDIDWIRSIVEQCQEKGIPVFVKQLGDFATWNGSGLMANNPKCPWFKDYVDGQEMFRLKLSSKGGDIEQFPVDLRVRQMPQTAGVRG